MWKKLIFANLLLAAVTFTAANTLFGLTDPPGESLTVPDFTGETEQDVSGDGRWELTVEYRYGDEPAGTVLSQEPAAGSVRKRTAQRPRCPLRLTVSMGPETVRIPDLEGEAHTAAAAKLRELGFSVEEIEVGGGTAGTVSATDPPAGDSVRAGSAIRLYVQSGTDGTLTTVPELIGMPRDEAMLTLFSMGFTVGSVQEEFSVAPTGTVIRQTPSGGSPLPSGAAIHLVVSSGAPDPEPAAENPAEPLPSGN